MTKRPALCSFQIVLLFLFAAACKTGNRENAATGPYSPQTSLSGIRGGNLSLAVSSDPRTFNVLLAYDHVARVIAQLLSADLIHVNRATLELEPSLASSWKLGEDGRTYTLTLRQGLRFSDGSPFTAEDVLFTFQVLQDPKINSPLADSLKVDGVFPAVSKIDSQTIRIVFPRPVGIGLRALDSVTILPGQRLQKPLQEGKFSSAWGPSATPAELCGMGPFRLKEYQPGARVVLERNPHYWKKDKSGQTLPYLDTITFLVIPDRNAQVLRFQAGELDLLDEFDPENYPALQQGAAQGGYIVHNLGPGLTFDFIWFNLNPGRSKSGKPFVDPDKRNLFERPQFRRAVAHALNRPGMTRAILLGLGEPQRGPISPGNKAWHDDSLPPLDYNPDRSRHLLSELGLTDSDGDAILEYPARRNLEFTLLTARGSIRREKVAEVARQDLLKIGMRVNVQLADTRELIHKLAESYEYESMLFGFTPADVEPESLADVWLSSGNNHFWYPNQAQPRFPWEREMDLLTTKLVRTLDPEERKKIFFQVQEIWAREMPAIPTICPNILVAWKNRLGNVRPSILRPHISWNAEELTVRGR